MTLKRSTDGVNRPTDHNVSGCQHEIEAAAAPREVEVYMVRSPAFPGKTFLEVYKLVPNCTAREIGELLEHADRETKGTTADAQGHIPPLAVLGATGDIGLKAPVSPSIGHDGADQSLSVESLDRKSERKKRNMSSAAMRGTTTALPGSKNTSRAKGRNERRRPDRRTGSPKRGDRQ
jgi:hypothetical protein